MRGRAIGVVAWSVAALCVALHAVSIVLYLASRDVETPGDDQAIAASAGFLACFLLFPAVGALVVSKRPRHPVGWLLLYIGVALALNIDVVVPAIERLFGVQFLSKEVYYISDLPSDLQWGDVWGVTLIAFVLALLATLYPSWRASRVNPAEALRYE